MGDRFILRDTGRRLVVAGGRVLDPAPGKPRDLVAADDRGRSADLLHAALDTAPDERAAVLLSVRKRATPAEIAAHTGGGTPLRAVTVGATMYEPAEADRLSRRIADAVSEYHDAHPLRPGLPAAEALPRMAAEEAAALAARHSDLVVDAGVIRSASFRGTRTDEQERAWDRARGILAEAGFDSAPRAEELELHPDLLHALVRQGELVRVSSEFVYLPEHIDHIAGVIRTFTEPFTVSEFKDRANVSRKYAVPLLEWADGAGLTVRMGDRRRVRH
jgi:selenocysteine-specific elongation factor